MTVQKNNNRHTLQLVQETGGYGAGGSFASNAGSLLVAEPPAWDLGYQFDGKQDGRAAGIAAARQRIQAYGVKATGTLTPQLRAPGNNYSVSVKPNIHAALVAAGFLATLDTTATPFYSYAPLDEVSASMTVRSWLGGELTTLVGAAVSKVAFSSDGVGKPIDCALDVVGILSALDDASFSSVTYANQGAPIQSIGVALTWLGLTLKTRKWALTHSRELTERVGQWGANGEHQGFELGARTTQLTCTIEAPARVSGAPFYNVGTGAFDPRKLYEAGSPGTAVLTVGPGGNRFTATIAVAQLADAAKAGKDGAIQLWDLTFDCTAGDEVAGNDLSIKFN